MITWTQLAIHRKPVVVVNTEGYFDPLLAQFDRALAEGFLRAAHREQVVSVPDAVAALDAVAAWVPPEVETWLEPPRP